MWAFKEINSNKFIFISAYSEYVLRTEKDKNISRLYVVNTEPACGSGVRVFKQDYNWDVVPVIISFNEWEM